MARRKKKKGPRPPQAGVAPADACDDGPEACPRCERPVDDDADGRECPACGAAHHAACWEPGCAACAARPAATTIVAAPPPPATGPVTETVTEATTVAVADPAPEVVGTPVPASPPAPPERPPETGAWGGLQRWVAGLREEFATPGAAAFLLAIVAVAAYANCFNVPFLFDDAPVITRNRLLWQWETWPDLVRWNPTRALTNLTFLANFKLAGTSAIQPYGDTWTYHVVSLALHVVNALLLFKLVRDLLLARAAQGGREVPRGLEHWAALLAAVVWVAHPANTMAVTYIAQRYALLAATAFLGTLVLYVRLRARVEREGGLDVGRDWPAMLGLAAAGLCCFATKENAFVIPGAVVLVEALFFRARYLLPMLGVGAAFGAVGVGIRLYQVGGDMEAFLPARSPASDRWQYATTQVVVTLRYLHLWFMPHDLCVEQSFPFEWATKGRDMAVAALGHGLILALAGLLLARGLRFVPFAVAWYYLTNLVESSIIPILDPMVDHRMYLPTAMLAPALAVSLARAWPWLVRRLPRAREAAPLACMGLVVLMVVGTLVRNAAWASSTGIWEDTIRKRPDCARAYSSLGMEHLYAGEWLQAIQPIETALHLGAYHVEGWNNLGKAYLELEQWEKAAHALERGIQVDKVAPSPSTPLCWNNLGLVFFNVALRHTDPAKRRESLELAASRLAEAVRLDPGYEMAWINLGNARFQLMNLSEGEQRRLHAEGCVAALGQAERVALRRGGALSVTAYRYRSLAMAEMGRALDAFPFALDLAELYGATTPQVLEDLGRLAVAAAEQHRADAAAGDAGPAAAAPAAPPEALGKALTAAATGLDGLLAREPGRVSARALRAKVALCAGDRAKAVALLREGLDAAEAGSADAAALEAELRRVGE
ncbi:MAG: hypothetical protein M9894_29515 [Planctomycetes bacterium]|nr:hypothetical protein [Planctomycetota bacterium]